MQRLEQAGKLTACPQECGHSPRNHNRHGCKRRQQHRCSCIWKPNGDAHRARDMAMGNPDGQKPQLLVRLMKGGQKYWPTRNKVKLPPSTAQTSTIQGVTL